MRKTTLSSTENRPAHVSLTHFLRRKWCCNPYVLRQILSECDVSPYVGALPPELRARVRKDELSDITYEFRMAVQDFLIDKIYEIQRNIYAVRYDLPRISQLFNTECHLDFGALKYVGVREWAGTFGIVGKLSFPELNATYALKIFDKCDSDIKEHGALYEIPTAFAAMHAEPRDNARVYMASFIYEPYMLSRWEGDQAVQEDTEYLMASLQGKKTARLSRKNENEIFATSEEETAPRNYRNGRRIDFGETSLTEYGTASYRVRKMCRKILNAVKIKDADALRQLAQDASVAAPAAEKDFRKALNLVYSISCDKLYELIRDSHIY